MQSCHRGRWSRWSVSGWLSQCFFFFFFNRVFQDILVHFNFTQNVTPKKSDDFSGSFFGCQVYTAWRLATSLPNASVCLFERHQRLGGRIASVRGLGPKKDLVVEAGAYRFLVKPTTGFLVNHLVKKMAQRTERKILDTVELKSW